MAEWGPVHCRWVPVHYEKAVGNGEPSPDATMGETATLRSGVPAQVGVAYAPDIREWAERLAAAIDAPRVLPLPQLSLPNHCLRFCRLDVSLLKNCLRFAPPVEANRWLGG